MIPFFLGILGVICVLTFYYFKNINTRTLPLDASVRLSLNLETIEHWLSFLKITRKI